MNNELLKKTITVSEKLDKVTAKGIPFFKLKDENNLTYTLFTKKVDGNDTVAFKGMQEIGNVLGQNVEIVYKEEDQEYEGKPYKSRTIIKINLVGEKKGFGSAQASAGMAKAGIKNDDKKWEDINFGKCKHQFLIEMFKHILKDDNSSPHTVDLKSIERDCEEWATMSMRKLDNIENIIEKAGINTEEVEGSPDHPQFDPKKDEVDISDIPF